MLKKNLLFKTICSDSFFFSLDDKVKSVVEHFRNYVLFKHESIDIFPSRKLEGLKGSIEFGWIVEIYVF